jgi:tetratricopeptide (TPR) repeat protein
MVLLMADWDWSAAERGLRKSLELNPGYVRGHQDYAELLAYQGRLDESMAQFRIAEQLDPFWVSSVSLDRGSIHAQKGEPEEAMAVWGRALELAPDYYRTHLHIGNHLCETGAYQEGIASLERARALSPGDPHIVADIGYCHAISGQPETARKLLRELEAQSEIRYISQLAPALIHVGLGEKGEALDALERAYQTRALLLTSIGVDTRYQPLRSDPRFMDLLRRIGLTI